MASIGLTNPREVRCHKCGAFYPNDDKRKRYCSEKCREQNHRETLIRRYYKKKEVRSNDKH